MKLLAFLILTIPTDWELFAERKGEAPEHKKTSATVRVVLMLLSSVLSVVAMYSHLVIMGDTVYPGIHIHAIFSDLLLLFAKSLLLSFAIFVMFFDYLYNIFFHGKAQIWYSYLSKSPLDRAWSGWNWKWRMAVRIVIFVSVLTWFLWN